MTEIFKQKSIVTVNFRVFTTNTNNGDSLECDENGVLFSQNTDFSGFSEEYQARQALEEINKKYPPYNSDDECQEYQKYRNKNWIEKHTYIVLVDEEYYEFDEISITEILK